MLKLRFLLQFFAREFLFALSLQADNGVAVARRQSLVKGNPVKIGSYTRSCESKFSSVFYATASCGWEGAEGWTSQKTCLIFLYYATPRVKAW